MPDGLTLARWAAIGCAGLLLAAIIHIIAIKGIPAFVPETAHARVAAFGSDGVFNRLPNVAPDAEPLPMLDPMMMHAACRFDLADGPRLIRAALPPPFWSFALFNRRGEAIYSLNDRTSGNDGRLDVLVLTPQQLSILRENPPLGLEDMIVIETPAVRGYALLRGFDDDPLLRPRLVAALDEASCDLLEDGTSLLR